MAAFFRCAHRKQMATNGPSWCCNHWPVAVGGGPK